MKRRTGLYPVLAMLLAASSLACAGESSAQPAAAATTDAGPVSPALSPGRKVALTNAGVVVFMTAWGYANWDYGQTDWHRTDEGWFGQSTKEGGADKAGHLYSTYVLGRSLSALFRHYGHEPDRAAFAGVASAFGTMTLMELGDGYSPYGFSEEDAAMNLAGAGAAWLLEKNPQWDRRVAIRGEYHISRHAVTDFFTDYERWRYYLTLKLDGFDSLPEPLRWLELHAGYAARGYSDADIRNDRRETFVGIGFSFSRLARESGWRRTGVLLDYFQPPHTTARHEHVR
ncbi:MAG: DUF2279 domain-containing protein [Pseudomonadota bacterium]